MTNYYHLVVLVHGLWGTTNHMEYIQTQLEKKYSNNNNNNEDSNDTTDTSVVVYIAKSFEFYYTYDGIDVCGTRVANEIEQEINRLNSTKNNNDNNNNKSSSSSSRVTKLSIIGYSLGGLISRYCIGLLYQRGLFDPIPIEDNNEQQEEEPEAEEDNDDEENQNTQPSKIKKRSPRPRKTPKGITPVTFTTFASPHVGVLALGTGPLAYLYNAVAPHVLSYTSRQLCLADDFPIFDVVLKNGAHKLSVLPTSVTATNTNATPNESSPLLSKTSNTPSSYSIYRPSLGHSSSSSITKTPLLECMADPALPFFRGLARFRNFVVYGNIINDHRTEWYTTGITTTDPYSRNAENIIGPYVPGYSPIIIDTTAGKHLKVRLHDGRNSEQVVATAGTTSADVSSDTNTGIIESVSTSSLAIINTRKVIRNTSQFLNRQVGRILRWSVAVVKVTVIVPVWFVAFVLNAGYQTSVSMWRKKRFINSEGFQQYSALFFTISDNHEDDGNVDNEEGYEYSKNNTNNNINSNSIVEEVEDNENNNNLSISQRLHEEAGEALDSVMGAVKYESQLDLTSLSKPSTSTSTSTRPSTTTTNSSNSNTNNDDISRPNTESSATSNGTLSDLGIESDNTTTTIHIPQLHELYHHNNNNSIKYPSEPSTSTTSSSSEYISPRLNLDSRQLRIISNLNKLAWQKFPVHITHATHTHAAIIVRYPTPLFDEGKQVVDHFVSKIFEK